MNILVLETDRRWQHCIFGMGLHMRIDIWQKVFCSESVNGALQLLGISGFMKFNQNYLKTGTGMTGLYYEVFVKL
jgi:hypothetical protein